MIKSQACRFSDDAVFYRLASGFRFLQTQINLKSQTYLLFPESNSRTLEKGQKSEPMGYQIPRLIVSYLLTLSTRLETY